MSGDRHASFQRTLVGLTGHAQGHHGWTPLHREILDLHRRRNPRLDRILTACWQRRPAISDAHLVTLLGVAMRRFGAPETPCQQVLDRSEQELAEVVCLYSNSFTGVRRFLVAQSIIAAFASSRAITEIRHLDVGTGLGLLPRQLNHRTIYERFAVDLRWHPALGYAEIPLVARYGTDMDPVPTLDWVEDCHGSSTYYDDRLAELHWTLREAPAVAVDRLDLRDEAAVRQYMTTRRINTVTCNMVLYQYEESVRRTIINSIVGRLDRPGLLLTMEPRYGLLRPGARVDAYVDGSIEALHVADLSDAHALGEAWALPAMSALMPIH